MILFYNILRPFSLCIGQSFFNCFNHTVVQDKIKNVRYPGTSLITLRELETKDETCNSYYYQE